MGKLEQFFQTVAIERSIEGVAQGFEQQDGPLTWVGLKAEKAASLAAGGVVRVGFYLPRRRAIIASAGRSSVGISSASSSIAMR